MAIEKTSGKAAQRHVFGPRPIGAVLPAVTRPAFRSAGAALGMLVADWPDIIGPVLAGVTMPRRLAAGTLTLGCAGPVAIELQHLSRQVLERVNLHLGRSTVQRLRFVQEPASPKPVTVRSANRAPLTPVEVKGIADGPLHDALAALGAVVRAERA